MNYTAYEISTEQWKDIFGYDGAYQVSDLGRVRSHKSGEWKVLSASKRRDGYLSVDLWKNGKKKNFLVHRLVAQAFIPNDDENKTQINHRDECKDCNKVSNIEWCSAQYNVTYNDLQFRKKNSKRRKIEKLYNPDLTYHENIAILNENGIECSNKTIERLRKELGLTKQCEPKRDKVKELYDHELSINENIEMFKTNGISCSRSTVLRLRKELGLTRKHKV